MKSIKKLLAAVLSVAMICSFATTSFAAVLDYTNVIEFKAVVSPATAAPGEDVTVSVYVTDKTNNDNVVLTGGGGIIFELWADETNFTYKSFNKVQNYGTINFDDKGNGVRNYALDVDTDCTIDKDTALFTCVYTVNENVDAGTYNLISEMKELSVGDYEGGLPADYACEYETNVTVKAAEEEKDDEVTAETDSNGVTTITYGSEYTGSKALEGKKIVVKTLADTDNITKETRFNVTFGDETKPYGGTLWDHLGLEGKGALAVNKLTIAIAFDADVENVTAANVSVALVK